MGDTYNCLACGRLNPLRGANYTNKYCNNKCQQDHRRQLLTEKRVQEWLQGCGLYLWREVPSYIKDYLIQERGHRCVDCGTESWNGKLVPLLAKQADGDPYNNTSANLKLVCYNCNAQE